MTNVAITGATGRVGGETIEAFANREETLTLFSHSEPDDLEATPIEIGNREEVMDALDGQDIVVHLAANPDPRAEWDAVQEPNIEGVYNVYAAAVEHDLQRVVFASSNHAVNMDNTVSPTRPESTIGTPTAVQPDDPMDPDTYYGVTKVFGEAMGSYYANRHGLDVINLRIGWLLSREELADEIADRDGPGERYARAMWLSPDDCQRLMKAAVTSSLPNTPVTAHGISNNSERFLSLTETMLALEYQPQDDSARVLE
ncbi:GalE family epimerase/dehydratase [Natrialba magadii ATCC 43099]|uniref:GalE family epimerase/dehydratase n=1 Tax=Natrialba magadii (strain ATCC 43099 / DSM 3394 / CCM 3739 / CIP 104546 / IAM 13178 / JCM 8861 / NBRC 102185 / NCIMB 2190 / MS3) TaxID=547559 RepID=D3SS25_NATMM|nr:NAD(P)-dependent oxidoreductase [Natrialba magadii]ADD04751.1 GalE family epimerase/dehydratase [Natrialba magadii ATCC 43099]ELY24918.1 NAD-dependent epimerase/dehydratase [Natrialba magadii ATCC 43099]